MSKENNQLKEGVLILLAVIAGGVFAGFMFTQCNSCYMNSKAHDHEYEMKYIDFLTECSKTRAPAECRAVVR